MTLSFGGLNKIFQHFVSCNLGNKTWEILPIKKYIDAYSKSQVTRNKK